MRPRERFRVGAVVLAAGASARLGRPKQLLLWQGRTLLRQAAENALASGASPVIVVLGASATQIAPTLDGLAVKIVVNADWEEGMASSLRAGINVLASVADPAVDAALVSLCDQPFVTPEILRALIAAAAATQNQSAVVSEYKNGATGPPSVFSRALFPQLRTLTGAQGAKQVLAHLPAESILRVPFPEGVADIDTADDWRKWNAMPGLE